MYGIPNLFNIPSNSIPNIGVSNNRISNIGIPSETHYTILGISNTASEDDIKKAYRKRSLEYHPDRNNNDREKANIFKKVTEAYTVLSDPVKREQYDFTLKMSQNHYDDQTAFMNMFLKPFDTKNIIDEIRNSQFAKNILMNDPIAAMAFGNISLDSNDLSNFKNNQFTSSKQYKVSKPTTINHSLKIDLIDAYKGCKIPLNITRWKKDNDTKYEQTETIYINIPKGIDNNEIITLKEKGNAIDDIYGDIDVKICVSNNSDFERNGIDLIFKKSITLKESFCGFTFNLKYIDDREFKINNQPGNVIPPNFRKIISNLGMHRDNDVGNLIIIFDVIYPKQLNKEQITILNEVL